MCIALCCLERLLTLYIPINECKYILKSYRRKLYVNLYEVGFLDSLDQAGVIILYEPEVWMQCVCIP